MLSDQEKRLMGYSVFFEGSLAIEPALTPEQVHTLTVFARTGRTPRVSSEAPATQIVGESFVMQVTEDAHFENASADGLSERLEGQPSRYCCWRPTPDGRSLEWDGCEKFGQYEPWTRFLIETFFAPWERRLEGRISWRGEDGATGALVVSGLSVRDEPDNVDSSIDDDVRALLVALRGTDPELRLVAARELTCASDASVELQHETVTGLCLALADPHLTNRALESLGELGETAQQAVAAVTPLLEHPDPQVRYWATFAVARMGAAGRFAIPLLQKLTTDAEYGPRYGAIDALKRLQVATNEE
jgi:hypothetical protein